MDHGNPTPGSTPTHEPVALYERVERAKARTARVHTAWRSARYRAVFLQFVNADMCLDLQARTQRVTRLAKTLGAAIREFRFDTHPGAPCKRTGQARDIPSPTYSSGSVAGPWKVSSHRGRRRHD